MRKRRVQEMKVKRGEKAAVEEMQEKEIAAYATCLIVSHSFA